MPKDNPFQMQSALSSSSFPHQALQFLIVNFRANVQSVNEAPKV